MSNTDALIEAYTQAFETMRYYGNLRFTVLTTFILMSGGLFTVALRKRKGSSAIVFHLASFAGMLMAIVFGGLEWRIANNFEFYGQKAMQIGKLLQLSEEVVSRPTGSAHWRYIASFLLLAIYVGAGIMWLALIRYRQKRTDATEESFAPH